MLESERLILRPLAEEDEFDIVNWRNQDYIISNMFSVKGPTIEEHRKWYENYLLSEDRVEYIITKKTDGKKLGTIGLSGIDRGSLKAEYGIILGDRNEWGKGYAKEASILLLNYAFLELGLKRIFLKVLAANTNAVKLYDSIGFIKEGLLRKDILKNDTFMDVIIMSILEEEWEKRNG